MLYLEQRREIIAVCLRLQQMGYFLGTWGNVSVRVGDHIILTPSKVEYQTMKPEDLVVIDKHGAIVEGNRPATSEKEVHRQVLLAVPDAGAVIHAHTPCAMAVAASQTEQVPCIVEEMSQLLGGPIAVTQPYVPAEQHAELGRTAAAFLRGTNAVILKKHGPVACGRTLEEALLAVQVVEKACGIFLSARILGDVCPIPEAQIRSEHERYFYRYGHEQT